MVTLGDYPPGVTGAEKAIAGDPFDDFVADYDANQDQLVDWLVTDPHEVLDTLSTYTDAPEILRQAYNETHIDELKDEYDGL